MKLLLGILLCWVTASLPASAQGTARSKVSLVLGAEEASPGQSFLAGIRLEMPPQWHSYWKNSGDSGLPTKVVWTLPPGIAAGELLWPVPDKFSTPPPALITYGYHDVVTLLAVLTVAADTAPGDLTIKATVTWQECEKVCISGKKDVSASLKISGTSRESPFLSSLKEAQARLPQTRSETNQVQLKAVWETGGDAERSLVFEVAAQEGAGFDFFPYAGENYDVRGATELLPKTGETIRFRKKVEKTEGDWPRQVNGLLVRRASTDAPWTGLEVTVPIAQEISNPGQAAIASAAPAPSSGLLVRMLAYAFLGGLILNIMPCVLPVIALKIFSFVKQGQEKPERVRFLGLVYGAGVLASFAILAGVAIAIQGAGKFAGWSSAFQYPQFRLVLTALMVLVALNLFGVFEIILGGRALTAASQLSGRSGAPGAFFNGVLATILATPCTAPFLGVAVGFAFTQPPLVIVLTFLMVGLGLAFPFVLLCWHPAGLRWLPKPGAWMERFKIAMGFPMMATAIWLFWLSASRYGKDGVLWGGIFLVLLAMAAWIFGEFWQRGQKRRGLGLGLAMLLVAGAYVGILEQKLDWRHPGAKKSSQINWLPWSAEKVAEARSQGRPVLVDFTADGCLNCKWNKMTSIDISETKARLKEINAVTLEGDFTDQDEKIAEELRRYGRAGVPLVLVFPADSSKPPIVLPERLTPKLVRDALDQAAGR